VSEQRQKRKRKTNLVTQAGSEAPGGVTQVGESRSTIDENENLASTEHLMEEVLDAENLKQAAKRVMQNKGAAGIDGLTVDELPTYLAANWVAIRKQLQMGTYAPQAVRRVEIPKATGGMRQLGIPTVVSFCTSCSFLLG
jgi:RNA-directed DNA polymerase